MSVVIRARLSLALRLIDTTTGRELTETDIHFDSGAEVLRPMFKGDGFWVFTGESREDFSMHIKARGYDELDLDVRYEKLDPKLPICDVFLMPSEKNRTAGSVIEIHGNLSKLESIEAVAVTRPICVFHEASAKRDVYYMNLMPLTSGGRVVIDNMRYALVSEDGSRYEVFGIAESDNPTRVVLEEPLKGEHKPGERVCRIIYGRAGPEGDYTLKVRDDGSTLPHLIRFTAGGNEYFRPIDFHQESGEIDLMDNAIKVLPYTGKETTDHE
ncbi:MAG: hypothetical protein IKS16_01935 [Lachnospiraceae bacterium]|nr:hypothetical protein [Lachnospiraceae bacterium]